MEDPDSEYRCFSQLLAGAIDSPVFPPPGRPAAEQAAAPTEGDSRGEEGMGLRQNHSPLVTVTPGLSLSSLLESPAGLVSSNLVGSFFLKKNDFYCFGYCQLC